MSGTAERHLHRAAAGLCSLALAWGASLPAARAAAAPEPGIVSTCKALAKFAGQSSDAVYAACLAEAPSLQRRAKTGAAKLVKEARRRCTEIAGHTVAADMLQGCAALKSLKSVPDPQHLLEALMPRP